MVAPLGLSHPEIETILGLGVRNDRTRITRPQNAWILYRKFMLSQDKKIPGNNVSGNSQKFSKSWRREPLHVIQFFRRLAEIGKESHKEAFPNYKYRPRKCGRGPKRRTTAITP